ncbi:hypothetical protein PIB30_013333 [Stylosanthes scabra]|uniref:Uncharacterized protein n=1 Tax=Stylosanthes scabra TaxID=79078 RepID=A0ABU6U541_9FABA|nr:hypothetical protein [Stylosanthes scabra]
MVKLSVVLSRVYKGQLPRKESDCVLVVLFGLVGARVCERVVEGFLGFIVAVRLQCGCLDAQQQEGCQKGEEEGKVSDQKDTDVSLLGEMVVLGDEEVSCTVDDVKAVRRDLVKAQGEQLHIVTELVRHQAKFIESYGKGRGTTGKPPQLPPIGIHDMFRVPNRLHPQSDQGAILQPGPIHVTDDVDETNPKSPLKRRLDFDEGPSLETPLFPMEIHYSGPGTPFGYCNAADELYAHDMPKCLNLCLWPLNGVVFWASDIFDATYIFKADGLERLVCNISISEIGRLCRLTKTSIHAARNLSMMTIVMEAGEYCGVSALAKRSTDMLSHLLLE